MKNKSKILSEINYFDEKINEDENENHLVDLKAISKRSIGQFKRKIDIKLENLKDYILFETVDEHYVFVYKKLQNDNINIIKVKNDLNYNKDILIYLKNEDKYLQHIYYDKYEEYGSFKMNYIYVSVFMFLDTILAKEIKNNTNERLKYLFKGGTNEKQIKNFI